MVQVAQYPLFLKVEGKAFDELHAAHATRISLVVVPLMLLELVTGAYLYFQTPKPLPNPFVYSNFFLALAWGSTFFIQVPIHNHLSKRATESLKKKLVWSNWVRTLSWSTRLLLLSSILLKQMT